MPQNICQHIAVEDLLKLFAPFAVSNIPSIRYQQFLDIFFTEICCLQCLQITVIRLKHIFVPLFAGSGTVVKCCIDSGLTSIPSSGNNVREVPGWNDEVKQAKDQSLFWHWIWLESGRPNTGHVYAIMKRTRHQYHYSVRRCKLKKQEIQRTKLSENVLDPTMVRIK